MKKWTLGIGAGVIVAALCVPMFFGPSDSKLVREAVDESIKASRDGRPGGVMDYLSRNLKVNEEDVGNRLEIARYIKASRPDIVLQNPTPVIQGDTAKVITPATVTFSFGNTQPMTIDKVEITLAKETGTRYLVFPAPKWRIVDVKTSATDISQFEQ